MTEHEVTKANVVRALAAALLAVQDARTHAELVLAVQGLGVELGQVGPKSGTHRTLDGVEAHMGQVVERLNKIRTPSSGSIPAPPAAQAFHKAGELAAALTKK